MTPNDQNVINVSINKITLKRSILPLLTLIIIMATILWAVDDTIKANNSEQLIPPEQVTNHAALQPTIAAESYPISASDLNTNLFALRLPPPALDALPYDVRSPLSNGESVPIKKRWLWVPTGQQITITDDASHIEIPNGSIWWKEFYIETDRGTFLIERRIILKVPKSPLNPDGWAYYSSHHLPPSFDPNAPLIIDSTSDDAAKYMFLASEWLPTQSESMPLEVRFEDVRGLQYPYIFPGQVQCAACHGGSAGAYPNDDENPIFVFGLHPNNLTTESLAALIERGWITNAEVLLADSLSTPNNRETVSFQDLTSEFTDMLRNNCASCHNSSVHAAANYSAFIIDPNYQYTASELLETLSAQGIMFTDAAPLVTAGDLENSELWLRLNGVDGRRRMPPAEGGLPEMDPYIRDLLAEWIIQAGEHTQ